MSQSELILVPVIKSLAPITVAVLYARQARAYLKISSAGFNELVKNGTLVQHTHVGGKRPFYLKEDLDSYLRSTPRYRIASRESAEPAKGSSA
jgi:hypothetical protein